MLPSVTASDGDTEGGAPVVLSEMLATGMPVISTTHCDIPGVVDYGIENWLVAERDVQALVDRVQWLVDHASSWDEFLFAGRCHIEQEFNASIQGHNLGLIYRGIVEGQSDTLTGR
jgi:colanic acid/amylovoran biosynthesis glycosyltransferase